MSLFTEGMTGYTENPKQSPKKSLPEWVLQDCKIQCQYTVYLKKRIFLYINGEQLEI